MNDVVVGRNRHAGHRRWSRTVYTTSPTRSGRAASPCRRRAPPPSRAAPPSSAASSGRRCRASGRSRSTSRPRCARRSGPRWIISSSVSPSPYSAWLRVARPSGLRFGLPPSSVIRLATMSACSCSSFACSRNSSSTPGGVDALRHEVVVAVAQRAHGLGREHLVQDLDHLLPVRLVVRGDRAVVHLLARAAADLLDVGLERVHVADALANRGPRSSLLKTPLRPRARDDTCAPAHRGVAPCGRRAALARQLPPLPLARCSS